MIQVAGIDISMNNLGICKATINSDLTVSINELVLIQPSKADAQTRKQVRKNSDDLRRFRWLHDELHKATKDVEIITVEIPVGSQSARAMVSYAGCLGVLSSVSTPMIEVTPTDVKLAGAGIKTATKHEMIEWACEAHPEAKWKTKKIKGVVSLTNDNEHLADALGTIYAGMKTTEFKALLSMLKSVKNK